MNNLIDFRDLFTATSSNSDKIHLHGYQRIYPWFLHHLIDKNPVILEIGFYKGESIPLWKEYFKNPEIHICDINADTAAAHDFTFHLLDQSKAEDWTNFRNENKDLQFNFILDDGSHVPEHQVLTLNNVWPMLAEGGIYIIEDIETSYWNDSSLYGYNFNAKKTSVFTSLLGVIDIINKKISSQPGASSPIAPKFLRANFRYAGEVESIAFGYNCIILIKKENKYQEYYNNTYSAAYKVNETENTSQALKYRIRRKLRRIKQKFFR